MDQDEDKGSGQDDERRRPGLLASLPKRTLARVLVLIAALFGILYLRARTTSIAGCMSDAFRIPAPATESAKGPVRARIELRLDAASKAP